MENYPINIIGIKFSEDCPEALIEPAKKYYELNDSFEFNFKPGTVKANFDLTNPDMRTIRKETRLICDILCSKCQDYVETPVTDQSHFKRIMNDLNGYVNTFLCEDCLTIEKEIEHQKYEQQREKDRKERLQRDRDREQKLNEAIDNKKWRELNLFQFEVMKNCLLYDSFYELKQYYWDLNPTKHGFKSFFSALMTLEKKDLITTESKFDYHKGYPVILDYNYINRLKSDFEYDYEVEEQKPKNNNISKAVKSGFTNSLKMRLTINDYQTHPDNPLYAGTITFDKKIIIEPKVQYTFAQWKRSNDDLFFTLIPTTEIEKLPVQKTLSQEPKILQEHITNFLNNIEIEK